MKYLEVISLALVVQVLFSICALMTFQNDIVLGFVIIPMALFFGYNGAEWLDYEEHRTIV